ncbi:MAG: hypothetical protein ACI89L_002216 [Phycisphaerales bacterium]|jgi:hypothetical protein
MLLALSPYHLTTREPAAMAAIQLAERLVTLIPTPAAMGDPVAVQAAAEHVPRFVELIETWRWSSPLWDAGLIASGFEGDDARADVSEVYSEIQTDPGLADLCAMLPTRGPGTDEAQLDAIARDLLRAGPDPTISIPVAAGLDRFGARHGLIAVRASGHSMAQRAEASLSTSRFRCAIPVLTQASAPRLLELRAALLPELEELRAAIRAVMIEECTDEVRQAAAAYTDAFEREREDLLRTEDDDTKPKVRCEMVVIEGVELPLDAVLRSSVTAARRARGRKSPAPGSNGVGLGSADLNVGDLDMSGRSTCLGLVVRVLGR